MRLIERVDTGFQTVEVWKSAAAVELRVAGAAHAYWHRERFLTGLAWDMISAGALLGAQTPKSILMLGLAGGTAFRTLRHLLPDVRLTAVDIDPGIVGLAREHMQLDALGIEVILGDAYQWLRENHTIGRKFDVVIDDLYLAGKIDVFRPQDWGPAMVEELRSALAPGGSLVVNLVTGRGHRIMQSRTRKALRGAFPVVKSLTSAEAQNEVLAAGPTVAGKRRLANYGATFAHWRDLDYWQRIKVRSVEQRA